MSAMENMIIVNLHSLALRYLASRRYQQFYLYTNANIIVNRTHTGTSCDDDFLFYLREIIKIRLNEKFRRILNLEDTRGVSITHCVSFTAKRSFINRWKIWLCHSCASVNVPLWSKSSNWFVGHRLWESEVPPSNDTRIPSARLECDFSAFAFICV